MNNMRVMTPCDACIHKPVCANKDVIEEVQKRVNDKFFGGDALGKNHYDLINAMTKSGITVILTCSNQIGNHQLL